MRKASLSANPLHFLEVLVRAESERRPLDVSRAKPDGPNLPATSRLSAFLNIPYDDAFQHLYLAYIAGFAAKGLTPRATLDQASTQAWRDP